MKYNFDTFTNRRNLGAAKYERMLEVNPELPEDIIPLSIADMEFNTAPEIVEGLKNYLEDSVLGYPEFSESYIDAVKKWFARRYDWEIQKNWIVPTQGVVPAIYTSVDAFTEPGDGVILFPPVYGPFFTSIIHNGRRIIRSSLVYDDGFKIDFEDFEKKAKDPSNKLLLFCNPHNPVGRVWSREELEEVARICLENDIIIFSDEIHADIIMPGNDFITFGNLNEEVSENLVVATAPSKTFNIAGLYNSNIIIKNEKLRDRFSQRLEERHQKGSNVLGLKACEIAYNEGEPWLEELISVIDENRKFVVDFVEREIEDVVAYDIEGTYLIWLDFRRLKLSDPRLDELLEREALLFLTDGKFFGDEGKGFKRINIACPKKVLEDALMRLKNAVDRLKEER
ncbi:MAG: MalY/PatB family protein [Tissierellia bacterium]|nr:MalY/PatB family protein [Tissierellia bacterium]